MPISFQSLRWAPECPLSTHCGHVCLLPSVADQVHEWGVPHEVFTVPRGGCSPRIHQRRCCRSAASEDRHLRPDEGCLQRRIECRHRAVRQAGLRDSAHADVITLEPSGKITVLKSS